jgi:hypothetical protein
MALVIRYVDFICDLPMKLSVEDATESSVNIFMSNISEKIEEFLENENFIKLHLQFRSELPFFSKIDLKYLFFRFNKLLFDDFYRKIY